MYMVPLMFMGMFMHVHACSCMLNSGCPDLSNATILTSADTFISSTLLSTLHK